ncbi:MAG: glycosyltransferase family 39 protein [Pseudorhodoplanes sp.]|jgi:4-amino-4-deoxy-L-arabinose transferase-like glycosyltransferase|nr:glycosyltransferase family 39 protein [Pseudorhodoplanes sp.]
MHFVSLPIEILRTKPRLVFWLAVLTQATLWILVPSLFYATPPGELAELLSTARHFERLLPIVPPLAYWLAEIALRLAGFFGVYVLSQICIVVALWAVFTLGRATLGERHAALGTLLMTGIYFITVPTPEFSPAILAMPLWALALLHFWRAVAEGRELYWLALAVDLVLLLLTTYLATFLIGLLVLFGLLNPHSRSKLATTGATCAALVVLFMLIPHAIWLKAGGNLILPALPNLRSAELFEKNVYALMRMLALLLIGHAGLSVIAIVAASAFRKSRSEAALIIRTPPAELASPFIYYFALVPPLLLVIVAVIAGHSGPVSFGPVVLLSGLAIVLAAGDIVAIFRQRTTVFTWFAFLLAPPAIAVMTAMLLPWAAVADPRVAMPSKEMGRFFTENFERRTGQKLAFVTGDPALAALIAVGSPSRPFVFDAGDAGHLRLMTQDQLFDKGAIVIWRATDSAGTPPNDIRARFPGLVPEVPRVFERRIEGRLPQLRLGWAMIRPKAQTLPQAQIPSVAQ